MPFRPVWGTRMVQQMPSEAHGWGNEGRGDGIKNATIHGLTPFLELPEGVDSGWMGVGRKT